MAEQDGQLLSNGSVESGGAAPDGWSSGGTTPEDFELEWSSVEARSGTRSLMLRRTGPADSSATVYWSQSFDAPDTSGVMYELSAYVKVDGVAGTGVAIAIRGDDDSLGNGQAEVFATTQRTRVLTGTRNWQRYRIGMTAVPASVNRITVYLLYLPGTTGTAHFDDVTVELSSGITATPRSYLSQVLGIMQYNSINRYVIDWPEFADQLWSDAAGARQTSDVWYPIQIALTRLGDRHSFLQPPPPIATAPPLPAAPPGLPAPPAKTDPWASLYYGDIGYVEVPAFSGAGSQADALADQYHRLIEGIDASDPCGWVVDLRGNTGGNMWPMVAGIGPIVGEGVLGYTVDPDDRVRTWSYANGASYDNGFLRARASNEYVLTTPDPPVAVLTDSLTASSGEATAITFRGRADARSFGKPTWGVSTANGTFPLDDGAILFLTTATMADRTGELYGQEVVPDEIVDGVKTQNPATDAALQAAIGWLHAQPACTGP